VPSFFEMSLMIILSTKSSSNDSLSRDTSSSFRIPDRATMLSHQKSESILCEGFESYFCGRSMYQKERCPDSGCVQLPLHQSSKSEIYQEVEVWKYQHELHVIHESHINDTFTLSLLSLQKKIPLHVPCILQAIKNPN